MFGAEERAVVEVILQTELGEFAGIKRQVRRETGTLSPKHVGSIKFAFITVRVFTAEPGDPPRAKSIEYLRIKTPIAERFRVERRSRIRPRFEALIERLRLPGHKGKASLSVRGFPLPIQIDPVDLSIAIATRVIGAERGGRANQERLRVVQIE